MSDCLWQHTGFLVLRYLPVCSNSLPLNWWYHPMISSTVKPLFTLSLPVFWCHIKNNYKIWSLAASSCFLPRILQFQLFDPFWVNFYIYCVRWECSLLHSHVSCFPSTICEKKLSFPHWMILVSLLKIIWVFISKLSIPFACDSVFMPVQHYLINIALQ